MLKVLFVRKVANIFKYPTYNPNASVFDELGMRIKNQPFLQIAPLMLVHYYTTLKGAMCKNWQPVKFILLTIGGSITPE